MIPVALNIYAILPVAIPADSCLFLEDATPFHFGILSSAMHMAWVRQVCGRLESRYRYSNKLVYNTNYVNSLVYCELG